MFTYRRILRVFKQIYWGINNLVKVNFNVELIFKNIMYICIGIFIFNQQKKNNKTKIKENLINNDLNIDVIEELFIYLFHQNF